MMEQCMMEQYMKNDRHVSTATLFATLVFVIGGAAPLSAQVESQLSGKSIVATPQLKMPANSYKPILQQVSTATMSVKQIEAKLGEFPQITTNQYKIAFECHIKATPTQTDHSRFPRYSCVLDQMRTSVLNNLPISRVDYFPSATGVLTRIVMVADKNAKNPNPGRILTAFQLIHEKNETTREKMLKDFVYADGWLSPAPASGVRIFGLISADGCAACAKASCYAENAACRADPECASGFNAIQRCNLSDEACFDQATANKSAARPKVKALLTCMNSGCLMACGGGVCIGKPAGNFCDGNGVTLHQCQGGKDMPRTCHEGCINNTCNEKTSAFSESSAR
jgi:hypothetical protein